MELVHNGLVYLLYTVYLLLVIVGFLTKVDMPQISNVTLSTKTTGTDVPVTVAPMGAIPSKEAHYSSTEFPELGRSRLEYAFRKADPSTGLVRHTFKVTFPTLKSVVTDPSGPYQPPPSIDYVTVAEVNIFIHPRSTDDERKKAIAAVFRSTASDTSFIDLVIAVASGQTVY